MKSLNNLKFLQTGIKLRLLNTIYTYYISLSDGDGNYCIRTELDNYYIGWRSEKHLREYYEIIS